MLCDRQTVEEKMLVASSGFTMAALCMNFMGSCLNFPPKPPVIVPVMYLKVELQKCIKRSTKTI